MATTKKTTVSKNTVNNKKSATTKRTIPVTDGNETKVMCPVCGTEFAIGEHEHEVKNAVAIGKDSGLGTVYLPVSKRAEALNAAGVGTKKYFAMNALDGSECLMTYDDNGRPVPVNEDDPIIRQIIGGGTVPNKHLFRRWVMSQVFRGLSEKHWRTGRPIGFTEWMKDHGYEYTWEMLIKELHAQTEMHGNGDMENFEARNRWFNKDVALAMAHDYIKQLRDNALHQKTRNCKGAPYIRVKGFDKGVFVEDIAKKLIQPLRPVIYEIATAKTPERLEQAVRRFWREAHGKEWRYDQAAEWKDAYKGAGAYFTMQNLLRFHGCTFPKGNTFYSRRLTGLEMLEQAATAYGHDCEGWRLFGLMKQMIEENHIDIEAKRKEWAEAKKTACTKRRV